MRLSKRLQFQNKTRKVVYNTSTKAGELLDVSGRVLEADKCDRCGKLHERVVADNAHKLRYLTLVGNLHANYQGGILGNGDWDINKVPVYTFCPECLIQEIRSVMDTDESQDSKGDN